MLPLATLLDRFVDRNSHRQSRLCIGGVSVNGFPCFNLQQTISVGLFPIPVVNIDPP
jgi:hypothetical protein